MSGPVQSHAVADVLRRAADLIEPEGAWTQNNFGRDMFGAEWDDDQPVMPGAVCWCALGAIAEVTGSDPWKNWIGSTAAHAMTALEIVVSGLVAPWNDDPRRTQGEVVAALRQAADLAMKPEASA